jgi:ferredoxin
MQLYYFSGTGNSLHIAQELQKRMPESQLVPIVGCLREQKLQSSGDRVGIIFPIHAHTFPAIVKKFLEKVDLQSASYIFAIANRFCADKVFKDINKLLQKKNRVLNASFAVNTPVNYIPVFQAPTEEEIRTIEEELQAKLDEIARIITEEESQHEKTGFLVFLLAQTMLRFNSFLFRKTGYFGLQKAFYADDKCISCGICEKVCLANKIRLVSGKPVWDKEVDCTYCFACISYCPMQAIQAKGKRTKKKGRYHHPDITASDIASQKKH